MLRVLEPTEQEAERLVVIDYDAFPQRRAPWTVDDFRTVSGWVIADDAVEKGYIIVQIAADQAEIINLAVVPSHRREGLGTELLSAAEEQAYQHGASEIFLDVAADNSPALALYKRSGYQLAGKRSGYYLRRSDHRVDAHTLKKNL